jgi:hypothetical protein
MSDLVMGKAYKVIDGRYPRQTAYVSICNYGHPSVILQVSDIAFQASGFLLHIQDGCQC